MFCTLHMHKKLPLLFVTIIAVSFLLFCGAGNTAKANDNGRGVKLPILMYHSMLKEEKYQGAYVVSPDMFQSDLEYLKKNGYTTVVMQDLIDYVNKKAPLPEKPIMITFDDGYYNNYLYAYPLLKKYHMKMVLSPIGACTDIFSDSGEADHPNYSHCTWNELKEMMDSGCVEVQNHTYNLHSEKGRRGAAKKWGESVGQYEAVLTTDLMKVQNEIKDHTGWLPTTFVYPFGEVSSASIPVVKKLGFQGSMNCQYKMNYITEDPECLYNLGRYLRPGKVPTEKCFRKIGID